MPWIAPSGKCTDNNALEKRVATPADQRQASSGLTGLDT
jgi:hypothetical protein